jgi:flagellar motor switch protein FliN
MNQTSTTGTQKALLIDHDQSRSMALEEVLRNCGYKVVAAEDAASGQILADSENFDVALCQEFVAGANGVELMKSIRKSHPKLPFIIMTESADSPSVVDALSNGAADVFTTPNDHKGLYPKLAAIQAKSLKSQSKLAVQPVELPQLSPTPTRSEPANVDMIMDVPVAVNAILGNTTMRIADLLQLGPGSVVELDKRAGEPVDLYVNDRLMAIGEVVVVNETFGVRITEVIDPKQRVQALS